MTDRSTRRVFVAHPASGLARSNFPTVCEVVDGHIVRSLPFYIPDDVRLYEIRTSRRGTFTRKRKEVQMPLAYAWKRRVHAESRLRSPMLRRSWRSGNPHTTARGTDDHVPISWADALDIIAEQLTKVRDEHGSMEPVLVQADGHGQSGYLQSLHFWGHYLFDVGRRDGNWGWWTQQVRNPDSWEGYYWGAKHVWGFNASLGEPFQDAVWDDVLENAEMVIFSGNDPEATGFGMSGSTALEMPKWLKRAGIKIVAVSPDFNHASAMHADTWIPIRPNTDGALYLALAHVWLSEQRYDVDYVQRRTVGFDEYREHVLGVRDGLPKTPEWAADITGIPARTIRALAREWASKRTSLSVYFGGPKIRGTHSHMAARLEAYALAMQGLGTPGRQFLRTGAPSFFKDRLAQVPRYPDVDRTGIPMNHLIEYAIGHAPKSPSFIPRNLVAEAILDPPVRWRGTTAALIDTADQFVEYGFPPREDHPGIRLVWNENGSQPGSWGHGYKWLDALRHPNLDFVVGIHPWLENDLGLSDLILPAQTIYEHEDIIAVQRSDVLGLFYQERAIDPVGESRSDYEIHQAIAERMGLGAAFPPVDDWLRAAYEPTVAARGLAWEEFKERGGLVYDCPTWDEWVDVKAGEGYSEHEGGLSWFSSGLRPLETPSGKIEFASDRIRQHDPDTSERPAVAVWREHADSAGAPGADEHPLTVVTNHPRFRFHVQGDDIDWIRELSKVRGRDGYLYEKCWISPADATPREIHTGDVIRLRNHRGQVLLGAHVTERVIAGSVVVEHGARLDIVEVDGQPVDRGGCINLIAPSTQDKYPRGEVISVPEMNVSGFRVQAERLTAHELEELVEAAAANPAGRTP